MADDNSLRSQLLIRVEQVQVIGITILMLALAMIFIHLSRLLIIYRCAINIPTLVLQILTFL